MVPTNVFRRQGFDSSFQQPPSQNFLNFAELKFTEICRSPKTTPGPKFGLQTTPEPRYALQTTSESRIGPQTTRAQIWTANNPQVKIWTYTVAISGLHVEVHVRQLVAISGLHAGLHNYYGVPK